LNQGNYTITAVYEGTPDFAGSTSSSLSQQVAAIGSLTTDTVLDASPNPAIVGQSVTFIATVIDTTGEGIPSGNVTFLNNGAYLGTASVSDSGVATFTTSSLVVGTYDNITANYSGDSHYASSSDSTSADPVVIDAAGNVVNTTVTLTPSPNPAVLGQQVTFTATVNPASGSNTPTGTVTFTEGATTLGTSTLEGGMCDFNTSSLPLGSDTITATYGGDVAFNSSSSSVTETVQESATTTTLSASPTSSVYGQSVTLTATVTLDTTSSDTLAGTVDFLSGGTTLGSVSLTSGVATLNTSSLPIGTDSITASYEGNVDFGGSSSSEVPVTVAQAATSTTLTASSATLVTGQYVVFTATVAATSPGSGTPTGTVEFINSVTGKTLGPGTLSSGVATFDTAFSSTGTQSIKAVYQGDTNFTTSTSTVQTETVTLVGSVAATISSFTATPSPATSGASVTFTAIVAPASGSGTPTGTVTFFEGSTLLAMVTLNGSDTASFSTSSLPVGNDNVITAVYSGDSTYAGAEQNVTEVIDAASNSPFSPAAVDAALSQETNWLQS
jgi:hypothetical protein